MKGVSPVLVGEGQEEWAEDVVEEATESHPGGIEPESEDPGGSHESRRL